MVTTRSQSNRRHLERKRGDGRSPSRYSVNSTSSGGSSKGDSTRKGDSKTNTPPKTGPSQRRASKLEQLRLEASRASGGPRTGAADEDHELLGRGHRISRPTHTLDEEYLVNSYYGGGGGGNSAHHPQHSGGKGSRRAARGNEEELVIHERYPPREAAQRALSSLQETLEEENNDDVASSSSSSSSRTSSSSGSSRERSSNRYHFRHHPEIREQIKKGVVGMPSSSSSSSSSSSEDGENEEDRGRHGRSRHTGGTTHTHAIASEHAVRSRGNINRNKRDRDSSIDSSISNESLREVSIEELARQDVKEHKRLTGRHSASDTDSADDDDGGVVTEREMKRAMRNAKESTAKNISINHYMQDAVGEQDERRARRRKIDRRYRHLLMLDGEAKQNEGGSGSGGTGGSGGSGGGGGSSGIGDGSSANPALGDIKPLKVDATITFDSVGGLPGHIVALREMVLLPLLYPQLLKGMNLSPPRGVLFVGPPGTGKTLMARALAVEGSRCSEKKVTFFMRKGADILSKWVGESERQLKLLFEEARRLQPSIIFFDEIDGLAPVRNAKSEQTQAALVATLLALLDGLDDRGQVVVIGATNRPDTMDPALRRPGRFDRELMFPLPDAAARRHILGILTRKQSFAADPSSDREAVIEELVTHTEGYSGADLKALCMEAGLNRLRTALPQLYVTSKKLVLPYSPSSSPAQLAIRKEDFFAAARRINPSMQRGGQEMHLTQMSEHLEKLFHSARESLLASLSQVYTTVARALTKERRDCSDLGSAVRHLSSFPIPYARHALMLFLQVREDGSGGGGGEAIDKKRGTGSGAPGSPPQTIKEAVAKNASKSKSKSKSGSSAPSVSDTAPLPAPMTAADEHLLDRADTAALAARQMVLGNVTVALLRGLPTFQTFMVHLPHVHVSFAAAASMGSGADVKGAISGEAAAGSPYAGGGFSGGHMYQLVQAVQRSSPCVVLLRGAEEWLQDQGLPPPGTGKEAAGGGVGHPPAFSEEEMEERRSRMAAMRYYLDLLADTEVILVIPCASHHVLEALVGAQPSNSGGAACARCVAPVGHRDGVETRLLPPSSHRLHPHFTILVSAVEPFPTAADLGQFVAHIYRTIALAFRVQSVMAIRAPNVTGAASPPPLVLAIDKSPRQPDTLTKEQKRTKHREAMELWRKVEYRRLQLRHVLLKWVSQFTISGRFKLLLSADLDIHPDNAAMLKEWRQHTKHTRIGLDNILEKLESEQYTCLSQFHDDVDMLVRNVRTFFRSRAQFDQRYRLKALELKETTLLNMYKINRNVVRFCEMHRDVQEPSPLSSDDDDTDEEGEGSSSNGNKGDGAGGGDGSLARALRFRRPPPAPPRPRRKIRIFGQRRRRRRVPLAKKSSTATATTTTTAAAAHEVEEEEEEGEMGRAEERGKVGDHGGSATPRRSVSAAKSSSSSDNKGEIEEPDGAVGPSPTSPFASPLSPLCPHDDDVEPWAVALLRGLTYYELHEVFQHVMQELDTEVRRRDTGLDAGAEEEGHATGDSPQPKPMTKAPAAGRSSNSREEEKEAEVVAPQRSTSRRSGDGNGRGSGGSGGKSVSVVDVASSNAEEKPEAFFARTLSVAVGNVRRQRK